MLLNKLYDADHVISTYFFGSGASEAGDFINNISLGLTLKKIPLRFDTAHADRENFSLCACAVSKRSGFFVSENLDLI